MDFPFTNKKFAPGDRVVYTYSGSYMVSLGEEGTVVCIDNSYSIGVCWDVEAGWRHTCDGHCPSKHGWYIRPELIALN